jgi:hypothetical protein
MFSALNAIPIWWEPEGSLLLRKLADVAVELALGGVPA